MWPHLSDTNLFPPSFFHSFFIEVPQLVDTKHHLIDDDDASLPSIGEKLVNLHIVHGGKGLLMICFVRTWTKGMTTAAKWSQRLICLMWG